MTHTQVQACTHADAQTWQHGFSCPLYSGLKYISALPAPPCSHPTRMSLEASLSRPSAPPHSHRAPAASSRAVRDSRGPRGWGLLWLTCTGLGAGEPTPLGGASGTAGVGLGIAALCWRLWAELRCTHAGPDASLRCVPRDGEGYRLTTPRDDLRHPATSEACSKQAEMGALFFLGFQGLAVGGLSSTPSPWSLERAARHAPSSVSPRHALNT